MTSARQPRLYKVKCHVDRGVAQLGSALDWGSSGRGFKSRLPDQSRSLRSRASGFGKGPHPVSTKFVEHHLGIAIREGIAE
jgi:hypothetical protein